MNTQQRTASKPPIDALRRYLETHGDEIEANESRAGSGDYLTAVIRLNAFYDDWTTAAVEAKLKAEFMQKQAAQNYQSLVLRSKFAPS